MDKEEGVNVACVRPPWCWVGALTPDSCNLEVGSEITLAHTFFQWLVKDLLKSLRFSRERRGQLTIWSLAEIVDTVVYDPRLWRE